MGKLGHTLFLFSLPYICINLSKNVDLTLSLRESVERTSYVWPYPAVLEDQGHLGLLKGRDLASAVTQSWWSSH